MNRRQSESSYRVAGTGDDNDGLASRSRREESRAPLSLASGGQAHSSLHSSLGFYRPPGRPNSDVRGGGDVPVPTAAAAHAYPVDDNPADDDSDDSLGPDGGWVVDWTPPSSSTRSPRSAPSPFAPPVGTVEAALESAVRAAASSLTSARYSIDPPRDPHPRRDCAVEDRAAARMRSERRRERRRETRSKRRRAHREFCAGAATLLDGDLEAAREWFVSVVRIREEISAEEWKAGGGEGSRGEEVGEHPQLREARRHLAEIERRFEEDPDYGRRRSESGRFGTVSERTF